MRLLSRSIFREVVTSSVLGTVLFTFVLFLQRVGKLFETLVRSSAPPKTVAQLFALDVPFTFSFTIPLGVLAGVLITLNRMSADGEITAMRANGISSRKVVGPILTVGMIAMIITATSTLWMTPYSISTTYKIVNKLLAAQLTAEVQPRIFAEQFPNKVLYVGDVVPGPVARWRNVFLADLTPAEERTNEGHERSEEPRITVASEALAVPDVPRNLIQLTMLNQNSYEVGKEVTQYYKTGSPKGDTILQASRPNEVHAKGFTEIDTVPLYRIAYHDRTLTREQVTESRLELHHRLALPPACMLLALLGIPLGVSTRKGGKSTAFVVTVSLAFLYWMGLIAMNGLAKQHKLPVEIAVWIPNAVFALIGLTLLIRLERPGQRDWVGSVRGAIERMFARLRGGLASGGQAARSIVRPRLRFPLLPQIFDTYVLGTFVFYFVLLLVSFVLMTLVYTFFELLNDIVRNQIPMSMVFQYLFFLTPKLIYDSTPVSVLVTVLITFGILTKHNEITAFKASGVSMYRLALPVLFAAALLSGGLFAFDHTYLPKANRIQDGLRAVIKGRAPQTYLHPEHRWIFGEGSRIFYYNYLDPLEKTMSGVRVYELDPTTFRLLRHISAERATWKSNLNTWSFENGWERDWTSGKEVPDYFLGRTREFAQISEKPNWFLQEVLQEKQMNFQELSSYIYKLKQSGVETIALQVQFYRKFSVPLFALIMSLISVPFAFLAGNRGAMAGVGISFVIAIAYWATDSISQQLGNVSLLPAAAAAWAPDVVFALAGFYFFSRMRT
jgi:LPS export ABC transporter permease LptG/LPS export ABC transporter permease LptF